MQCIMKGEVELHRVCRPVQRLSRFLQMTAALLTQRDFALDSTDKKQTVLEGIVSVSTLNSSLRTKL